MAALASASASVEVYSIDEAFVCCATIPPKAWEHYGHHLREVVARQVGIPVSVGLAPTKTLSKVANRIAKRDRIGAYALRNPGEVREALQTLAVEDIWGIGRRYSAMLKRADIFTAADFVRLPEGWVRQRMTITGLTIHRELRGMMCMSLRTHPRPRRSMVHSRSFGRPIRDRDDLREAVARYTGRLGARLRKYNLYTGYLRLFLVPPMRSELPTSSQGRALAVPTADSRRLIETAWTLLDQLRPPPSCRKAGVMALELTSTGRSQSGLFTQPSDPRVMAALDAVNQRFGPGSLRVAAEGAGPRKWEMKQQCRSPRYTTRWSELRTVNIDAPSSETPLLRKDYSQVSTIPTAKTRS